MEVLRVRPSVEARTKIGISVGPMAVGILSSARACPASIEQVETVWKGVLETFLFISGMVRRTLAVLKIGSKMSGFRQVSGEVN